MPNLVYSPGIRVYIQTETWRKAKGKILDVSDDIVDMQLQRRSDGVSTCSFTLTNQNRKYDQVFTPNDRIIIEMKRITWLRVYTGYLNSVPEVTVWPKDVQIQSSCTLKRLQYWYWDAYAPQTFNMIINAMSSGAQNTAGAAAGGGGAGDLSGVEAILQILEKVTNWPRTKVHIGQIPRTWFAITQKMAQFVEQSSEQSDKIAQALFSSIGAIGIVAGAGTSTVTDALKGKTIDSYTGEQLTNAQIIYTVGSGQGASTRDQVIALMASMGAGSNLTNVDNGATQGTGVFQMKASSGNGTAAQLMNINTASTTFFKKLIGISTRDNMSYGQEVATILGKGTAADYSKFQKAATDIVSAIQAAASSSVAGITTVPSVDSIWAGGTAPSSGGAANTNPATTNNNTPTGSAPTNTQPGTITGSGLVGVAKSLVSQYPSIPYTEQYTGTRMDVLTAKPPPGLDCSSFVQWVYLNAFGSIGPLGATRVVAQQRTICKIIDIKTALNTPGALCFVNGDHVEMSIGDGQSTIGAHHTGTFASIESFPSQFTDGGLLPGVNYGTLGQGGGTTGGGGAAAAPAGNGTSTTSGTSWPSNIPYSQAKDGYNGANGWDKLFGNTPWQPVAIDPTDPGIALSMSLTGLKTFLNDEALLPYLKNLMNGIMRSFCSAPNGDLIAWFPDYYGLWGTAAKFTIEPIEVLDFNVTWNDEYFVTHQYVATTPGAALATNQLDLFTGTVSSTNSTDPIATTESLAYTRGIASIDVPAMMYALFGLNMNNGDAAKFAEYITSKFGVRPNFMSIPTVSGPAAEFFCAVFYFMRNWSYQYNADVPLTFMPELWPGMLIQIPSFGFQAYVTTVTHSCRFGDGGQFNTTVNIASPAKIAGGELTQAMGMIPEAAGISSRVDLGLLSQTPNPVNATSNQLTQTLNNPSAPIQVQGGTQLP